MPANLRIGGVRVDFSANASQYHTVAGSVQAANVRLATSYGVVGKSAARQSRLVTQFTNSLQSSLIATIAYAAGVRALISVTSGTIEAHLKWEEGLVKVQKTAGLTNQQTALLGDNFERLLTVTSSLNRPLPVTSRELLGIAEVAGQMNIKGVPNIARFSETVALMGLTTDLAGADAANALGLIITNTDALVEDVPRIGAVVTALGNEFRGGERDILSIAVSLARSTAEFDLNAKSVLAYSAVIAQAGLGEQKAGTVFQRTLRALINATNEALSGQPDRLRAIANATDNADESYRRLIESITTSDFGGALGILLEALENLESVGTGQTRGSLLTLLFGGDQGPPVRIAEVVGVLTKGLSEVNRALGITSGQWESVTAQVDEALLFAETGAKRLVTVLEKLESQGRVVGSALSAVYLPVAENFKGIQVAIVGVAAAFASGFSRRRLRAASLFTGQLRIQAQVAQTAVRAAQRAVVAETAAYQASNVTGLARLTLADNITRAKLKEAAATRVLTASERALSRANRIGARAQRAWAAALAFAGGYIGLAITAITVLTTALYLFRDSEKAAEEGGDSLVERLKRIIDTANRTASGLSESQLVIRETQERITKLREEISAIESVPLPNLRGRGVARSQIKRALDERRKELAVLEGLAADAVEATRRAAATIPSPGLEQVATSFDAIALSLKDPTRQIRDFIDDLARVTELATERALFDLAIAPLPQFDQEVFTAAFESREKIQEKNLELERKLRDAETDQGRANALVAQTRARRDQFAIGTEDFKTAESKVEQAERQLVKASELAEASRLELSYSKENLKLDIASLDAQVRAQNIAKNARSLASPLTLDPPDLRGQAIAAADFLRQLELRVDTQEREELQLEKLARLRRVDRAELEASFEILNQFADAKLRADERILKAEERLVKTTRALAEVRASVSGREDSSDRILAARRASASAERALAEAKALREEFELLGPAAIRAAEAYGRATGQIAQTQIDSADLLQVANDLAESGVRGIEDALVKLTTEGGVSFREFANSIIADLLRIIYRATVTVALLRALGVGTGGSLTGEGLLGRIGLGGGSGGVGETIKLHKGGIAGDPAQRHQGLLRANERVAVLEKGEEVLTRRDPRHRYNFGSLSDLISRLPRYHEGGIVGGGSRGPGSKSDVKFEIINRTLAPLEIAETTQRYDGRQEVVSIILEDLNRTGPIAKAMRSKVGRSF